MSPKYIIYISIFLLSGCGEGNNGYGWEYDYKYKDMRIRGESTLTKEEIYSIYKKATQCFIDKPPPFIIFTDKIHSDDISSGRCGLTISNPPLILIKTPYQKIGINNKSCGNQKYYIAHELVHYFRTNNHKQSFKEKFKCIN